MIRLLEGVYRWGYFNAEKKYNFNGYILSGAGGCVIVDPPPLTGDDAAYLETLGLAPDMIVVTNRNHLRDAAACQKRWQLPLAMHEAELDEVELPVFHPLKDGRELGPGLRVVHLPGKSPGEIGLHWPRRGVLMLGDALIAPRGRLRLIPDDKLDDPALLRRSLRRLEALEFEHLLVGDGDPLLGGAKREVAAFLKTLA